MRELSDEERAKIYNMFMKAQPDDQGFWKEDEVINLSEHVGRWGNSIPPFGYPCMNFNQNPLEMIQSGVRQINSTQEFLTA